MTIELPRHKFLAAAATLFCAPAIVRVSSLMPVRVRRSEMLPLQYDVRTQEYLGRMINPPLISDGEKIVGSLDPPRTIRVYIDVQKIRDRNMLLPADAYHGLSLVR